jgi:hypothetical protein
MMMMKMMMITPGVSQRLYIVKKFMHIYISLENLAEQLSIYPARRQCTTDWRLMWLFSLVTVE